MEARELRIGNWIYNGTQNVQLEKNGFSNSLLMHVMQPIEITEEWLDKFGLYKNGFEKLNNGWLDWQDDVLEIGGHDSCTLGMMWGAPCKHVHQLQNLYHALTGKELTNN